MMNNQTNQPPTSSRCPVCEQPVNQDDRESTRRFVGSFLLTDQVDQINDYVSIDLRLRPGLTASDLCPACVVRSGAAFA